MNEYRGKNLKQNRERYVEGFGERKGKGDKL